MRRDQKIGGGEQSDSDRVCPIGVFEGGGQKEDF